jgi:hypothetical protein
MLSQSQWKSQFNFWVATGKWNAFGQERVWGCQPLGKLDLASGLRGDMQGESFGNLGQSLWKFGCKGYDLANCG